MPAPKRSSSTSKKSSTATKPAVKRTSTAARSGAKATASGTRKTAGRSTTPAKATAKTAKGAAAKTTPSASRTGADTARATSKAATRTRRTGGSSANGGSVAEQLARGEIKPREVVMLTRDRIQEALDDAAARGRVTRKDANDLVAELVRRGRQQGDELRREIDQLLERGRGQLGAATRRARKTEPVDRLVRDADRARRRVGVGPSFPILGYDDLNATQINSRLPALSKPELRKVLTYERSHANRKSVTGALQKAIR